METSGHTHAHAVGQDANRTQRDDQRQRTAESPPLLGVRRSLTAHPWGVCTAPPPAHAVSDSWEPPTGRLDSFRYRDAADAATTCRSLQSRARGMSDTSSI